MKKDSFQGAASFIVASALALSSAATNRAFAQPLQAAAQTQSAQPAAQAAEQSAPIQFGAWERPAEGYNFKESDKPKHESVFGAARKAVTKGYEAGKQAVGKERFAELFIKVTDDKNPPIYIHAFPVDPVTGERRAYNDLNKAKLRVMLLTEEQHNKAYADLSAGWKNSFDPLPSKTPENLAISSTPDAVAKMLDVAEAINAKALDYQADSLKRTDSPTNGNAAIAAIYSAVAAPGVCPPDKCPALEGLYSGIEVQGVNNGLATKVKAGDVYQQTLSAIVQANTIAKEVAAKTNAANAAEAEAATKTATKAAPATKKKAGSKAAAPAKAPAVPAEPFVPKPVVVATETPLIPTIVGTFTASWPFKEAPAPTPPAAKGTPAPKAPPSQPQ